MKEYKMVFCSMCGDLNWIENLHKEDGKLYCDLCYANSQKEKPLLYKMDDEYYDYSDYSDYEVLRQFCHDGGWENINDLVLETGVQTDEFVGKWFMKEDRPKDYQYTQDEKIKIGAYLASTFMLHRSADNKGRYMTHWGDKTALGVFETFNRIGKEIQNGTFKFC